MNAAAADQEVAHAAWNIAQGLVWSARRYPDKIAVQDRRGRRFTYRQLNERVNRLAHAIAGAGLSPGDRLLMLVGDRIEHLELLFAAAKIGVVAAPVDHRWQSGEIDEAVRLYAPHGVVYQDETNAQVPEIGGLRVCLGDDYEALLSRAATDEALRPVAMNAPFVIGSTSGSSGVPKGIMLSHRSMLWRIPIYAFDFGFCPDDLWLSNTPMAQGGGRAFAMATLIRGGSVIIDDDFDPERAIGLIEQKHVTTCFMVPTMFRRILDLPQLATADTSSLRCTISTGAPLPPEMRVEVLKRLTPNLYQFYSSTESGGVAVLPPWFQESKGDSVGISAFGKELRLGSDGEILSRGPAVMSAYFNDPQATAAAFDGDWFKTGDIGRLDADGFLHVVGRKKEMIISGGLNIYPAEVERVLYTHPAVAEAAVIGHPDPEWGEVVKAFIQLRLGATVSAEDIVEHCRARIASYKKPRLVEFLPELPRTSNGKIAKQVLRSRRH